MDHLRPGCSPHPDGDSHGGEAAAPRLGQVSINDNRLASKPPSPDGVNKNSPSQAGSFSEKKHFCGKRKAPCDK